MTFRRQSAQGTVSRSPELKHLKNLAMSLHAVQARAGGSFVRPEVAKQMMSLENYTDSLGEELETATSGLSVAIEQFEREFQQDVSKYTKAQLDAAKIAGALTGDMRSAWAREEPRLNPALEGEAVVMVPVADAITRRPALEAYDESNNKYAAAYSVAYNLSAARQDPFGEAFYQTITVSPDQPGFGVTARIINVMEEQRLGVEGAATDFGRRNLLRAFIDSTVLRNDATKVIPIMRDEAAGNFVSTSLLLPRTVTAGTEEVSTSALAIGKRFNLLSVSQTEALLDTGLVDTSDSLDAYARLEALYLTIQNADGSTKEVLKFPTTALPTSLFAQALQGDQRVMNLNFSTNDLRVADTVKKVDGADSTLLTTLVSGHYVVRLSVEVSGSLNLETATINTMASDITVVSVRDTDGVYLSMETGVGKNIADLFKDAKVVGYDVDARRSNLNRRERGQLLNTRSFTYLYGVPLRSPVSHIHPVGGPDTNDAADLAALIMATHVRTSNAAVTALLEAQQLLKAFVDTKDSIHKMPEILGVSRFLLARAFYKEENVDVATITDSRTSTDRLNDLRNAVVNKLRDLAATAYRETGYKIAADAMAGGQAAAPTVVIGTDPYIAQWLMIEGDFRTLGPEFKVKVVSTYDERVRGKLFMTFTQEGTEGTPNPLSFGNMAWKPETTTVLPITRNGATNKELTVAPSFIHIQNLPILIALNISGITNVVAGKVAVNTHTV